MADSDYGKVEALLKETRPTLLTRLDVSTFLIAELQRDDVISPATVDSLRVPTLTKSEKVGLIIDEVLQKGTNAFRDFCRVLLKRNVGQRHIVEEVFKIDVSTL